MATATRSKEEYLKAFTPLKSCTAVNWTGTYKDLFSPDDKNVDSKRFIDLDPITGELRVSADTGSEKWGRRFNATTSVNPVLTITDAPDGIRTTSFLCKVPTTAPIYGEAKAGALNFTVKLGMAFGKKVILWNGLYNGKGGIFGGNKVDPSACDNFWELELPAPFDVSRYYTARPDAEAQKYLMQQMMIRVRDPKASLDFYTKILGFQLVMHRDFPKWSFSVYFVASPGSIDLSKVPPASDPDKQWDFCMNTPGCVELTWNYGSESKAENVYNTGNSSTIGTSSGEKVKGGFGHIGITVPDVYTACERFKRLGVDFHKTPNSGGMKGLAFIKDPDGYLIEVLPQGTMITKPIDCFGNKVAEGAYADNST